ncbi:hypothetical protein BGZ99_005412 [Dissophora globulifera]|uniref:Uncharacterized protein n=1 Tax=Dissophora globulifera TaxID=979702 RepID=A0A9P6RWP6_9FUNG|nr:hypothetical protein BGZ99_005412 [Dissophora globulifera]
MNGSYFMGPRAPQYIPSPVSSPVSPGFALTSSRADQDIAPSPSSSIDAPSNNLMQSSSSHSSLSAAAADLQHDHEQEGQRAAAMDDAFVPVPDRQEASADDVGMDAVVPSSIDGRPYDDNIKVDVTELYENFGQKKSVQMKYQGAFNVNQDDDSCQGAESGTSSNSLLSSSLPLKLPELSFSSNDLSSLWTPGSDAMHQDDMSTEDPEKRTRMHTFHGHSEASQEKDQLAGSSAVSPTSSGLKLPTTFPPKQSSPLKMGFLPQDDPRQELEEEVLAEAANSTTTEGGTGMVPGKSDSNQPDVQDQACSDEKRLSLVTSTLGPAAAAAGESKISRNALDLPTWDLAPLSPPIEVKETGPFTTASPMNTRHGLNDQQNQDSLVANNQHFNGIVSPASATVMIPTSPLTSREARLLAGREALLRASSDKQQAQRGLSASSTSSSIASSLDRSTSASGAYRYDVDTLNDTKDASRSASIKSQQSQNSQQTTNGGGIFGAIPERGNLKDVPAEKLVFPDQSIRPVPLKAYRVRKMTLRERNESYAQACQEFTRARTGLDVWGLRCMMQDRPALMKDPPAIVKAVAGKYTTGSPNYLSETQSKSSIISDRMAPTAPVFNSPVSSIGNTISGGHGIGARIKNASKRLSMDASAGGQAQAITPEAVGHGSFFYKQKSTRSAVELGSWSSGRARGVSNNAIVSTGVTLPPHSTNGHRNSISGLSGAVASSTLQQQQQLLRGTPVGSPSSGSIHLPQSKRHSIGASSSPLSNTLRSRTMTDVHAGSRLWMASGANSPSPNHKRQQQQRSEVVSIDATNNAAGGQLSPLSSSFTDQPLSATTPVFVDRPIQRSMSNHYTTRRPASMMDVTQRPGLTNGLGSNSATNNSFDSRSSSSIGSASSNSVAESMDLKLSSKTPSLSSGSGQQQQEASVELAGGVIPSGLETPEAERQPPAQIYNADGTPIPYADETKSKDEVYSPLTSPIMIPLGGFPVPSPSPTGNGGWMSPQSAGGGLTRPLTYAGPSSSTLSSNSSLIMSPSSALRDFPQQQPQSSHHPYGIGSTTVERGAGGGTLELVKDKIEKSSRYSTASFSSISSFARNQKRSSKKDRKKELLEQQHQQNQQQQRQTDQRFSVSSASVNQTLTSANDYWTEQSLDKLSDVLPHVDRDRLSIYLQRAFGDEMVAIGLAMSDLRSGQL